MNTGEYEYSYPLEIRIYTADDSRDKYYSTLVNIYSTYPISRGRNRFADAPQVLGIRLTRTRVKGEPMILSIKNDLQRFLGWGARGHNHAPKTFKCVFEFTNTKDSQGNPARFIVEKEQPYYHLMRNRMTKKNLMIALSRGIYRSCFEEDSMVLIDYLYKMITLPENVSYVLENKTPYWFFKLPEREKVEVRLNTKLIGPKECALEISDGIWAPIGMRDLDIFVDYFYHGHARAKKWAYKSPKKIWEILMGNPPSSSQEKLMMEFLTQNRTQELVENRAKKLMDSLTKKYPNRIKLFDFENNTIMLIRGKLCDWVIIDSAFKTNIQKVKTYAFISHDASVGLESEVAGRMRRISTQHQRNMFYNGNLQGPICIDNIHDNSSVGDQYAARALALLNDDVTLKLVYTIARYLPKTVIDGEIESRFDDFDTLDENAPWGVII